MAVIKIICYQLELSEKKEGCVNSGIAINLSNKVRLTVAPGGGLRHNTIRLEQAKISSGRARFPNATHALTVCAPHSVSNVLT